MRTPDAPAQHRINASADLHLSILQSLVTPILVLSSSRVAVFVNRAAERVLGTAHPIPALGNGIQDRRIEELGVKLGRENTSWDAILDEVLKRTEDGALGDQENRRSSNDADDAASVGIEVVIDNPRLKGGDRDFVVLPSAMVRESEVSYVLSFEKVTHNKTGSGSCSSEGKDNEVAPSQSELDYSSVHPSLASPTSPQSVKNWSQIKKAIFESSNVSAFLLSSDEKFCIANKKARELFGDVVGDPEGCDALRFRDRTEMWNEDFTRKLDRDEFPGLKLVRTKRNFEGLTYGFTHWKTRVKTIINLTGECLYDDQTNEFLGGICWCRNVQEYSSFLLDQQEQKLISHETICNLMPHMVWTTGIDGQLDYFSERWYEFTGLTREQSIGQGFASAVHPEDLPKLMKKWQHHTDTGTECEVEVRYRRKDGIYKWQLNRACPLRDDSGKILKWYGTTTDIHDLVMQRIDARRNKLQILTVLAHAEVNLFAIDKDRKVLMAEGGMHWDSQTDTYDVNHKSTTIGQDAIKLAQLTQPGGVPGYEKSVLDVLSGKVGVAECEDIICGRVYRTRVVADLAQNERDGGGKPTVKGVLGLSIDVTDMKARADLELDNARLVMEEQTAREANKTKSQFLANMSHELRTPIAGVIGMAELLNEDTALSQEQREYINSILLSSKALLTIVNDILDFSKVESGRLDIEEVPFKLTHVLDELCKLLGMFAQQKGLDFIHQSSLPSDVEVLGDPGRVRQVLSNLLTNALKFTSEGSVKLSVSAETDDHETKVQFLIEDTGIGIEKSVLDKLFRPFSQGDASTARLYGGTGLGLTISQNLAKLMGGDIQLLSSPGKGSTAIFSIPFKISPAFPKPSTTPASPPNPGFKYYAKTSRSLAWTAPALALRHGSDANGSENVLNQQISNSVVGYTPNSGLRVHSKNERGVGTERHQHSINNGEVPSIPLSEQLSLEERKSIHVLVVEDNAINQTIATRYVASLGFPVTAVWNGQEALDYLLSSSPTQPSPSIILMDVQMPVMDGYQATRVLRTKEEYLYSRDDSHSPDENPKRDEARLRLRRRKLKDIPVIAMTASAIQGDKEKCYEAGMDDYLLKPIQKKDLEELLVKWAIQAST